MATFVIPHRVNGKTRLGDPELAAAMLADVRAAVGSAVVVDAPGGQGSAVAQALSGLRGPVTIVNSDLPCVTREDVAELTAAAPALVAADDGTTNALALASPTLFEPVYGPGSAERFAALGPSRGVNAPNLIDDVDTVDDLVRLGLRLGVNTRRAAAALHVRIAA
jgi:2-phospho-L-lactate guanylyltransferase (CobY/MobA/RfbA family)